MRRTRLRLGGDDGWEAPKRRWQVDSWQVAWMCGIRTVRDEATHREIENAMLQTMLGPQERLPEIDP